MRSQFKTLVILSLATAVAGHSVAAQAYNGTGSTTAGPTWNRPLAGNPPTQLSAVGTAVRYSTLTFTVTTSTQYQFQSTAVGLWDNFTFLYANSFNPNAPLTNVLIGNDDNPTIGLSGFTTSLSAGTSYTFVTTGFANSDYGAYSTHIAAVNEDGGVITQPITSTVPEPTSYALVSAGLVAVGVTARKRRQAA